MTARRINQEKLPQELLDQLRLGSKKRGSELDARIRTALDLMVDPDVNRILIAIYKSHQVVYKRNTVTTALRRLIEAGDVERAGRGHYRLAKQKAAQ